jgi:hypothetical protein
MLLRNQFVLAFIVLCVVDVSWQACACRAQEFGVDFGNGLEQAQFATFPVTPGPGAYREFATPLASSGSVGVRLQSVPYADDFEWRIRDQITNGPWTGMNPLLHDFVFTWSSTALVVTLTGLSSGEYLVTSYHHDTQFQDHGAIDILVSDANGSRLVAGGLAQTSGTEPEDVARCTSLLTVAQGGSVTLTYAVTTHTGNAAILNGLTVARVNPIGVEGITWGAAKCLLMPRQ